MKRKEEDTREVDPISPDQVEPRRPGRVSWYVVLPLQEHLVSRTLQREDLDPRRDRGIKIKYYNLDPSLNRVKT